MISGNLRGRQAAADIRAIARTAVQALSSRESWIKLGVLFTGLVTGVALTVLTTRGWPWPAADEPVGEDSFLVVLAGQDPRQARQDRIDAWNEQAARWNGDPAHRDRRRPLVKVVWLPSDPGEQLAEMLRRAQSPLPDVDVFVLDAPWTRQFAAQGYIRRLGVDVDTDGFLATPLRTCRFGDALYALPFNTDAALLTSWMSSAPGGTDTPFPDSWAALLAAAERVSPERAAFVGQFGPGEPFVVNVLEGVMARGGEILDSDGNLRLDGPGVERALRSLSRELHDPKAILPSSDELDEDSSREAFVRNEAVYLRNWPAFVPQAADGGLDPRAVVRRLPWPGVLGGQNLAIAAESRRPRAAQELLEWLTSEASQLRLFEDGGFAAARKEPYVDPKISRSSRFRYAEELLEAVDRARPRPSVPNYLLFSQVFERVMRRVLAEGGQLRDTDVRQITAAARGRVAS
jgi:multiple sugar transport system substrate-binding protein